MSQKLAGDKDEALLCGGILKASSVQHPKLITNSMFLYAENSKKQW
jgi:hypothetical protein